MLNQYGKEYIDENTSNIVDGSNFYPDSQNDCDMKILEAIDKSITGKEPIFEDDSKTDTYWKCPSCSRVYSTVDIGYSKYCPDCGQLLDWEKSLNFGINVDIKKEDK